MATPPKRIFTRPGVKPAAPTEPAISEDEPAAATGPAERPKPRFTRPTQIRIIEQTGRGSGGEARGALAAAGMVRVDSKARKQRIATEHDSED